MCGKRDFCGTSDRGEEVTGCFVTQLSGFRHRELKLRPCGCTAGHDATDTSKQFHLVLLISVYQEHEEESHILTLVLF